MIVPDPISVQSRLMPLQLAVVGHDLQWTYADVNSKINAVVEQLQAVGVGPDNAVGFVPQDLAKSIVLFWAVFRCRAVAVPISHRLPGSAVAEIVESVGCAVFVENTLINGQDVVSGGQVKSATAISIDWTKTDDSGGDKWTFDMESLATILQTSGSTGTPKLAVHRMANHIFSAWDSFQHVPIFSGDRWLASIPLNHVGGIAILFRCFVAGATVVIPAPGASIWSAVVDDSVSHVSVVTTQLRRILSEIQPSDSTAINRLRTVLCGGSAFPSRLIDSAVAAGLPVQLTYGMTEAASQVATSPVISTMTESPRDAVLMRHVEAQIVDDQIFIRGTNVFAGYLEEGNVNTDRDDAGWFATGDRGAVAAAGILNVFGRVDNMFVSGGENIQPEEIEEVASASGVVERVVVVPEDNDEYGYRPVAFVDLRKGCALADLETELRKKLPKFKMPKSYYGLPGDLRGESKINRNDLQRRLRSGEFSKFDDGRD